MMESDDSYYRLKQCIEDDNDTLFRIIRHYVYRAHFAAGHSLHDLTYEVWHDVVVQTLRHHTRFDPAREPRAWILGIASNMVKKKRMTWMRRDHREVSICPLESEIFDLLIHLSKHPDDIDLFQDDIWTHFAKLSASDREILKLGILNELNGEALGSELGISAAAARQRLHRAINRLRDLVMKHRGMSADV